ncbi:MAG: hypothetical protein IH940_12300 [Acidobacteria bacterium]|nr:hypothetical protein [Acidobacteriota bacterium]
MLSRVGGTETALTPDEVGAQLALAYPDRLAQARGSAGNFRLRNGAGAWVQRDDPLASEPFIVAVDLDGKRKNAQVRLAASVDPDSLGELADAETTSELFWDENRNDLYVRTQSTLGALRFSGFDDRPAPSSQVTAALIDRIRFSELSLLNWSARARALQKRLCFIDSYRDGWPDVSTEALLSRVEEWLTPYLGSATRRSDIEALDVGMLLQGELGFDHFGELDDLAPPTVDLPGGRPIPIDYGDEPRISVRPQRLYGLRDHPSVMGGAVPLVIEMLSPADRPIQVTTDLPGFWSGSWAEVRKEMAGRYPKHDWPVDPGGRQ